MAEKKTNNTDKQRKEQVRQSRKRKELLKLRARRKKLTRLAVYALLGVLAVLLVLALVAIGKKMKSSREERAAEEAIEEEINKSSLYDPADVLHLSFPVLALDGGSSGTAETAVLPEETGAETTDDTEADETEEDADTEETETAAEVFYPEPALTAAEFRQILQDLYNRGYMLVDLYSLTEAGTDGYTARRIMVPEGKKPLVLSQQDVSYSDRDRVHPVSLVKDTSGKVLCSYYDENNTLMTGAVDVVPIVEEFIAEHPDFSYKDARGILGVTGYRGLLGYQIEKDSSIVGTVQIDENGGGSSAVGGDLVGGGTGTEAAMEETEEPAEEELASEEPAEEELTAEDQAEERQTVDGQPAADPEDAAAGAETAESDAMISSNKKTIQELLGALRSSGWQIASNSYGLISYGSQYDLMKKDADTWKAVVEDIVGTTDILILPGKADIGGWSGYGEDNQRYQYLKELGFRQFCTEDDGSFTWIQIKPGYVRQGMHTIETYGEYTALMGQAGQAG